MQFIEQFGILGVFLASVIPFVDAIVMVPIGIAIGLNPAGTVVAAVVGDAIAILVFAFGSASIRDRIVNKRVARGKTKQSPKVEKAIRILDKYGMYAVAALAPIFIGTQIAALASAIAGVRPRRISVLIILSTLIWSVVAAVAMVRFNINFGLIA